MTENATSTDKNTPASSLADKERELIAQMPYEEARDKPPQARSPTSTELPPGAAPRGSHLSPDWTEFCFPAYDSGD